MRILIISRSPWRNDNSFGNSYSNIFDGMKNVSIANVYLADGLPDGRNKIVSNYYQIAESKMLQSVCNLHRGSYVGNEVTPDYMGLGTEKNQSKTIESRIKIRWNILYTAREVIWKLGKSNLQDMMEFIKRFNPDILFLPFYYAQYVSNLALYVLSCIHIPLVLEASIDIYSLKQLALDPIFWFNRFAIRRTIRKTVKKAQKLYVISEKMKHDYEKFLNIGCGILYKFPEKTRLVKPYQENTSDDGYLFLYTGNIGTGRWKTLSKVGEAIAILGIGKLRIYTSTPLNRRIKKALKNCEVYPAVTPEQVCELQNKADVLIHVESFNLRDKLAVRYSISTKIMDYISAGRCILGIGPRNIASIEFLAKNGLAVICDNKRKIIKNIYYLKNNPDVIKKYASRTMNYVDSLPSRALQQENLKLDLQQIIENYKRNSSNC